MTEAAAQPAGRSPLAVDALIHGRLLPKALGELRNNVEETTQQVRREVDSLVEEARKLAEAAGPAVDPFPLRAQVDRLLRAMREAAVANGAFLDAAEEMTNNFQLAMVNVSTHRFNTQHTPVLAHHQYAPSTLAVNMDIHSPSLPTPTAGKPAPALKQMSFDMFQQ